MTVFHLLIAFLVPILLGLGFLRWMKAERQMSWWLRLPCAFGLGSGFLTHWMLLMSMLGVPYSILNLHAPLLLTGGLFFFIGSRNHTPVRHKKREPLSLFADWRITLISLGLLSFIGYMLIFVFIRALTVPVMEWDAISWIALKGKVLFYERGVYRLQDLPNSAYPLHVPLLLAWIAMNLGAWSETLIKIIFPAYFILYAMLHYGVARLFVSRVWALATLALLMSANFVPYHATIAYRDIVMMFYFCAGILMTLFYWQRGEDRLLLIPAAFFGLGSFIKLEGALYMGLGLMVLTAVLMRGSNAPVRQRLENVLRCATVSIAIFLLFFLYKTLIGATHATQNTSILPLSELAVRCGRVVVAFIKELFLSANWHLTWVLFFLTLPRMTDPRKNPAGFITASATLLFLMVYILLGTFTGIYVSIVGEGSSAVISRILLHVFPMVTLAIVMGVAARKNY